MFSFRSLKAVRRLGWANFAEMLAELLVARVRLLGAPGSYLRSEPVSAVRSYALTALDAGAAIEKIARRLPIRSRCLVQALAARRILARRGIPSVIHIGVSPRAADRIEPSKGQAAHAWLTVDGQIVCGGDEAARFVPVASFTSC